MQAELAVCLLWAACILELERMIRVTTGKSALLSYSWYGCFCGIGVPGKSCCCWATCSSWSPHVWGCCCHAHDCCYRQLRENSCSPLITLYQFHVTDGDITCGDEQSWCKRETCLCDRAMASCFASALPSYNASYRFYFKLRCRGSKLQC
uniref:Phospholipase A2 n=1 Tax=Phasianus colchicus TaxID=9054 RepID=A0A669QQF9_PHACC